MMKNLLLSAAAILLLCSSCSSLIRQDPPQDQSKPGNATSSQTGAASGSKNPPPLTDRQIAEMSPDELERYMEERRRRESARSFSEGLAQENLSEHDRRQLRENVSRPMTPEERGSAFPWKGEPGFRSESLRDTRTFNH